MSCAARKPAGAQDAHDVTDRLQLHRRCVPALYSLPNKSCIVRLVIPNHN